MVQIGPGEGGPSPGPVVDDGRLAYRIRISSSIISSAAEMIRVAAE